MKKGYIFLFIFLVLVTSVFVWRKPLSYQATKLAFKYLTEKALGEKISFHDFELEKNKITLIEPKVGSKVKALENGGSFLEAEMAQIEYEIDWFSRNVKASLSLQKPKMTFVKTPTHYPSLNSLFSAEDGAIKTRVSLDVKGGEIELIDRASSVEIISQAFDFEANTELMSETQSVYIFNFYQNDAHCKSFINIKQQMAHFRFDIKNIQFKELQQTLDFWASTKLKEEKSLNFKNGVLSGGIDLNLLKDHLPSLDANLVVKDLHLDDKKTLLNALLPQASIAIKSPHIALESKKPSFREGLEMMVEETDGVVEIPKGAELLYVKNNVDILKSPDMGGKITLKKHTPTTLHLEGDVQSGEKTTHLTVNGSGLLNMIKGELEIKMKRGPEQTARLRASLDPYGSNQHKLYGQVEHFGYLEAEFIQQLLMPFFPEVKIFEIQKGFLDARFQCLFQNYRPKKLHVEDFHLKEANFKGIEKIQSIENISTLGSVEIDFSKKELISGLSGQLEFKIDELKSKEHLFEKLSGEINLNEGKIAFAKGKTTFSNLNINLLWDEKKTVDPLRMTVEGYGREGLKYAPSWLAEIYHKHFDDEFIKVELEGLFQNKELILKGQSKIAEYNPAYFGVTLGRKIRGEKKEQFRLFWDNFITPIQTSPALNYFESGLALKSNSEIYLKDGWFEFEKMPIEKFISPILFSETTIVFTGISDIKGKFDQAGLCLCYDNYDLSFDHGYFSIDLESMKNSSKKGYHYFNFIENSHFGKVYVEEANCQIKSASLDFKHLKGDIEITPDRIFSKNLSGYISDLQLSSVLNLCFLGDGNLDLMLKLSHLKGDLSEFKTLFSSLDTPFLENLPVEGKIEIDSQNSFFHLSKREEVTTKTSLKGRLTEGKAPFIGGQMLKQVSCDFSFDSDLETFEVKDFQSVWKSHRNQDYGVFSNYFKIDLFKDLPAHFDIKIKNSLQDCARLSGKLYLNISHEKPALKIILDQKGNHLGSIDLTNVYFALNDSFKLDYLNVNFSCNLNSLNKDITLALNLLPQLSGGVLPFLKWVDLKGDISGQWLFDLNQDRHQFFIWGDQVKIGEVAPGFFQLKGFKRENMVTLENFTYQQLKASGRVEEKPLCYFLKDFHLAVEDNLVMDVKGVYCKIFNSFQADISHFFCNLDELKKLSLFSKVPYINQSFGTMDLCGKVEGGYFKGDIQYELSVKGKTHQLKVADFLLNNEKLECIFKGNSKKIEIKQFQSHFLEAYQKPLDVSLIGNNLEYDFAKRDYKVEGIKFAIAPESIQSIHTILKEKWNIELPQSALDIKKEGLLEGSLSFNSQNMSYPLQLHFKQGRYFLFNQVCFLNRCNISYGPSGIEVSAKAPIYNKPYWFEFKKENFKKDAFEMRIYDQKPTTEKIPHLKINCKEHEEGLVIKNIRGEVAGLRFDFIHREEKDTPLANVLMGQLQIRGNELSKRLSWEMSSKLEKFEFGKGYFLTGQLKLPKNNFKGFVFEGLLGGQDFDLLGFEFKSLSSSITCSLEHFLIKDLKVSDLSGELAIDKIDISQNHLGYALNIPSIVLKGFKPSLLHKSNQGQVKHKPLIIEKLELENLTGNLSDLNTLRADGYFTFQKTPKKQASLLDIPVHLISKLGLDLTMLNPVEGKVVFKILDQKIFFNKLIEVYSHDRHCHFSLAKYPDLSYMDFDGNLNIKIKMKQYVLLKITEPFMISVQGHYKAPRYSFMRKKMVVDVPERDFSTPSF